jgi:hypothetical protein
MEWQDLAIIIAYLGHERRGPPVPPFDGLAEEAALWADWASAEELRAYSVAIFLRMPVHDRQRFLAFAKRRTT